MFSVTDFAKRARDYRGRFELFLVPGFELIVVLVADARGWGCQSS